MPRTHPLDGKIAALSDAAGPFSRYAPVAAIVERLAADAAAARFHLNRADDQRPTIVLIGGTGTGKSTLFNRLLGTPREKPIAATSYLRTYTAGCVLATESSANVPTDWLGLSPTIVPAEQLPAVGQPDALIVVISESELLHHINLVDTPDLDGDRVVHHAQADRAFRWADGVLFVVTPEKYQMTELLPYYRLANRYQLATTFVMNKVERQPVVDDYRQQLLKRGDATEAVAFAVPRDDAAFEPDADANLNALRSRLASSKIAPAAGRESAARQRAIDLLSRSQDQLLAPMHAAREQVDQLTAALRAMETPPPGVDVNPLTEALQRRLQQRSVLYLMGPNRVLDRVRQVPGVLARLPRTAWDVLSGAKGKNASNLAEGTGEIDFHAALIDQFTIVQSRIDDVVRPLAAGADYNANYHTSRMPVAQAGTIADEEIAALQNWISEQWNATPRDTAMLKKFLRMLPGGEELVSWSEAAPYVLAIVVAAHHAIFGPVDLAVMGTFGLITWLTEKVSNEVTSRARLTNRRIADRFARLAHQQITATCSWLEQQAPSRKQIELLQRRFDELQAEVA